MSGAETDQLLRLAAFALVLAGVAGTVLPALPGAPLVFAGLLLAAWIDDFQKVGWLPLVLLGLLTLLSIAVDFAATALGAQRVGASKRAVLGAALGTVAGLFFGLPGLVIGPFAGAVAGEYWARRDWAHAQKVGLGTWLGLVLGVAAKLALVFTMVGVFAFAYYVV
ncbi:MAG TPA: DUF456 family protein [Thermoanaerobaculia bacterium]|nr:DUF456 family protein [Thermoanaerobaculia bacterium]